MHTLVRILSLCFIAVLQACTSLTNIENNSLRLTQAKSDTEVLQYVKVQQKFSKRLDHQQSKLYKNLSGPLDSVAYEYLQDGGVAEIAASAKSAPAESESITNNQESSVDEGGIVKRYGDFLLILKRGKIYVVETGEQLRKVGEFNVQQTQKPYDSWYDELLIHKNKVIVIGYSYSLRGSEYQFFSITSEGQLEHEKTYIIKSSDYFDQNNYASRLVDGNLVFILKNLQVESNSEVQSEDEESLTLPTIATLNKDNTVSDSRDLFSSHNIYNPLLSTYNPQMTSVVVCPLDNDNFQCSATSVFGGYSAAHYVSRNAVYIWNSGNRHVLALPEISDDEINEMLKQGYLNEDEQSIVYRIPLPKIGLFSRNSQSENVTAVALKGQPIDQFSFAERDDHLLLVSRSYPIDKPHPYSDVNTPYPLETYALSIPLSDFSNNVQHIPEENYLWIDPQDYSNSWGMVNRFVDKYLLLSHPSNDGSRRSLLKIINPLNFQIIDTLKTDFSIAQIYPAGKNAVLLGNALQGNKSASVTATLQLEYNLPNIVDTYIENESHLAESRSHSFFYRPYEHGGIAGFPIGRPLEGESYKRENDQFFQREPIIDMNYFTIDQQLFMRSAGALKGDRSTVWSNRSTCKVSCTDWYGSARPIFIGDRIFALLKYELIEGVLSGNSVFEEQRINFGSDN